jgi:hypothetical protein
MSTTATARPGRPPYLGKPPQQSLRQPTKPPLLRTAQAPPPVANKLPATKQQPAKRPVIAKPKGPAQTPPTFRAWSLSNAELQAICDDPSKVSVDNYNLVLHEIRFAHPNSSRGAHRHVPLLHRSMGLERKPGNAQGDVPFGVPERSRDTRYAVDRVAGRPTLRRFPGSPRPEVAGRRSAIPNDD